MTSSTALFIIHEGRAFILYRGIYVPRITKIYMPRTSAKIPRMLFRYAANSAQNTSTEIHILHVIEPSFTPSTKLSLMI